VLALIELSLNIEFTNWIFADIHKIKSKSKMVKWDGLSRFNRIVMFGLYGSERNTNIRIYGICMIKTRFSIFLCYMINILH
jgi:hypothetical protein